MAKLRNKQYQMLADAWIEHPNGTQAAITAGYKEDSARQMGSKILKRSDVQKYIRERFEEIDSVKIAKQREVLTTLTSAMRGEIEEEVVVTEFIKKGVSNARIMTKQIAIKDRLEAAKQLSKRYDAIEQNGDDTEAKVSDKLTELFGGGEDGV